MKEHQQKTKAEQIREILNEAYSKLEGGNHNLEVADLRGVPIASLNVKDDNILTVSGNMASLYSAAENTVKRLIKQYVKLIRIENEDGSNYFAKKIGDYGIFGICSDSKNIGVVKTVLLEYSSKLEEILK